MWKKRKSIEGVGSSSMVDLKAVLYEREDTLKNGKDSEDSQASKKQRTGGKLTIDGASNPGVRNRAAGDKRKTGQGNRSNARALDEKTRIYESLVEGKTIAAMSDKAKSNATQLLDLERKRWQAEDATAERKRRQPPEPPASTEDPQIRQEQHQLLRTLSQDTESRREEEHLRKGKRRMTQAARLSAVVARERQRLEAEAAATGTTPMAESEDDTSGDHGVTGGQGTASAEATGGKGKDKSDPVIVTVTDTSGVTNTIPIGPDPNAQTPQISVTSPPLIVSTIPRRVSRIPFSASAGTASPARKSIRHFIAQSFVGSESACDASLESLSPVRAVRVAQPGGNGTSGLSRQSLSPVDDLMRRPQPGSSPLVRGGTRAADVEEESKSPSRHQRRGRADGNKSGSSKSPSSRLAMNPSWPPMKREDSASHMSMSSNMADNIDTLLTKTVVDLFGNESRRRRRTQSAGSRQAAPPSSSGDTVGTGGGGTDEGGVGENGDTTSRPGSTTTGIAAGSGQGSSHHDDPSGSAAMSDIASTSAPDKPKPMDADGGTEPAGA